MSTSSRFSSRPESKGTSSTPESSRPNSRPISSKIGSRPGSSKVSSRTGSNRINSPLGSSRASSRPGSSKISSRPGSSKVGSLPESNRLSSRPGSSVTSSRPASGVSSTRPGSSRPPTRPGSTRTLSRPASSDVSSRPVSVRSGSRPVSTKSVRLVTTPSSAGDGRDGKHATTECESDCDLFHSGSSFSDYETGEGRISRVLQTWMPDYVVHDIEPRERVRREPVYSARLGRQPRIQRTPSVESIATQLSLLSCSTNGKRKQKIRKRRRKKKTENVVEKVETTNKWAAVQIRRLGALDRMMRHQAAHSALGMPVIENTLFDMLEKDEQKMVFNCGLNKGLHLWSGIKKSGSTTDIRLTVKPNRRRRASEGETEIHEPIINFQEILQHLAQQKQAQLEKKQLLLARQNTKSSLRKKNRGNRSSQKRTSSSSQLSSDRATSVKSDSTVPATLGEVEEKPEVKTTMWAGDQQILAIDLDRELTNKVKNKIMCTTRALTRVTGYGDNNGLRTTVGTLEEYPFLTDEDYGYLPKIVQSVRISPQLSHVIQHDIELRMGRPRYHEISVQDLAMWNRGQELDRAYRNLKVFNWLHSLREGDFERDFDQQVDDLPPGQHDSFGDMIRISAVDEPKVKPLLERMKTQYIV